jgi:uncharacterized iron-regulated membrane protein
LNKRFNWIKWTRKVHYWGAFVVFLPVFIIISTGILLQLKKDIDWIQPPTANGEFENDPTISFDDILATAIKVKEPNIQSWDDVDRLDVRLGKGIVKVRSNNRWELQIDSHSGELLQVAYRRSDLIEQLHDGSWFHDKIKLWIFLPTGIILFILWCTGLYMVILPYIIKWKREKKS